MKKLVLVLLMLLVSVLFVTPTAEAKRKLPTGQKQTTTKRAGGVKGVTTKVKFRGDRRGIVATFSNLEIASNVSYSLTYTSRGIKEGAGGSLTVLSSEQTRELLFGTCSGGVCRYHPNPKDTRFTVTTTLKDGRKVTKRFRLRA